MTQPSEAPDARPVPDPPGKVTLRIRWNPSLLRQVARMLEDSAERITERMQVEVWTERERHTLGEKRAARWRTVKLLMDIADDAY
jgi:hypothetical protein